MRQFYGRLEKCVLSAGKTDVHKILRFRGGGYFGFWGGSADFIFMGARIFLMHANQTRGVSQIKLPSEGYRAMVRKLEKAVEVQNSLLEKFSGKFRRCWKIPHRFSGSTKCYPCQGLGIFRQGKRLLEKWPRLRERCWIFSSETPQPS